MVSIAYVVRLRFLGLFGERDINLAGDQRDGSDGAKEVRDGHPIQVARVQVRPHAHR